MWLFEVGGVLGVPLFAALIAGRGVRALAAGLVSFVAMLFLGAPFSLPGVLVVGVVCLVCAGFARNSGQHTCPYCRKMIDPRATKCPYCQSAITSDSASTGR